VISTVITNLNLGTYLTRTVQSALTQDSLSFEIIIIDAKSTDISLNVIKKFHAEDNRVHYLSEPDDGHFFGINKGLKLCKGNIIGILHSSDFYDKNIFSIVEDEFLKDPNLWILGGQNTLVNLNDKEIIKSKIKKNFLDIDSVINFEFPVIESTFFRKDVLENFGYFSTNKFIKRCHTNIFLKYFLGCINLNKKIKILDKNFSFHLEHENKRPVFSRNSKNINYYSNGRKIACYYNLREFSKILNENQKKILLLQKEIYDLKTALFFRKWSYVTKLEKKIFKILSFYEFFKLNCRIILKAIKMYYIYVLSKVYKYL
jgi:glycosyltransferase involved in cell wall biosynthesis